MRSEGRTILTTSEEWVTALLASTVVESEDINHRCIEATQSLSEEQELTPEDQARVLDATWCYETDYPAPPYTPPLKTRLNRFQFGPFFRAVISPELCKTVTEFVISSFRESPAPKGLPQKITVPSLSEQRRIAFESARYTHELTLLGRGLSRSSHLPDQCPNPLSHVKTKQFRYYSSSKILSHLHAEKGEILRAVHPLPFFFEAPLVRWESSDEKLRFHSAVACFQQLLKITCLLGLEELHTSRSSMHSFTPMSADLLSGIQGKPALGHWRDCLYYLCGLADQFPVLGAMARCALLPPW